MKLVEILARELDEWPDVAYVAVQDSDHLEKTIWYLEEGHKEIRHSGKEWVCRSGFNILISEPGKLATDHTTAIVTRSDWEAERAKLKAPKANGDGWVRNRGRVVTCPADPGVLIDVKWRGGEIDLAQYPSSFNFSHNGTSGDIMAYRLHKPAEQPVRSGIVDQLQEQCAGLAKSAESLKEAGPIEWRDRIRELDTQRAEVESTYQRQINEITQERESLVQKLAGKGLALVEGVVQPVDQWPEGAPDRNSAPEWATHIGRDARGFHWFDHLPEKFDDDHACFLKGCLGDAGYRDGRWSGAIEMENELPLWSASI